MAFTKKRKQKKKGTGGNMTREDKDRILLEELKVAHNNIMTVMENHIMSIAGCDRRTANMVANEVLDLDRDADRLLETPSEKIKREICWDRLSEISTQALQGLIEDDYDSAMEYFRDTIELTDEEREYFGIDKEEDEDDFDLAYLENEDWSYCDNDCGNCNPDFCNNSH